MSLRRGEHIGSLIIPIKVNGWKLEAVVDTAAQATVINPKVWERLDTNQDDVEQVIVSILLNEVSNADVLLSHTTAVITIF